MCEGEDHGIPSKVFLTTGWVLNLLRACEKFGSDLGLGSGFLLYDKI